MTFQNQALIHIPDGIIRTTVRLGVVAGVLILFLILANLVSEDADRQGALFYRAMAESPTTFSASPWGYRVLVPSVVHLMPFSTMAAFTIVTYAALAGSGLIIWEFLRHLRFSLQARIAATSLVIFSFESLHYTHNVAHVDPVTLLLLTASLPAVYLNRKNWVAALTIILAFSREMAIFIPILYAIVWYGRESNRSLLLYSGSLLGISLVIFGFIRSEIIYQAESGMEDFSVADNLGDVWRQHVEDPARSAFQLWWIFNFAWFVGLVGWLVSQPSLRRLSALIALAFIPPIVAFNWVRLVGLGVPAVAIFAAGGIERLNAGGGLRDRSTVAALFIVVTNALVIFLGIEEVGVRPVSLVSYAVLLAVGIVIWWPLLRIPASKILPFLRLDELATPPEYKGQSKLIAD